jgi:hypothetical protein
VLSKLDETLRHQLATTFDHVGTSDPRFFDRYWFCCYDPAGTLAVIIGMGLYNNMNVIDGFVALQQPLASAAPEGSGAPSKQWNYRFSRTLRPNVDQTAVGPLSVEIVEPFTTARVRIAPSPDRAVSADLTWTAFLAPVEEAHHFVRVRGRVAQDYRRYTQVGRMNGTITLGDRIYDVRDWFGGRDHSWGVRPAVAGPEPVTGPPDAGGRAQTGFVFFWLPFATDTFGGHVQIHSLGDGTHVLLDGVLQWPDGSAREVTAAHYQVDFFPGTRRWRRVRTELTDDHGEITTIVAEVMMRDWAMDGTGYDWGWTDGQGLGVWRGDQFEEHDIYDLTDPNEVIRPDGDTRQRGHREAPARLMVNGNPGTGHQIVLASGPVPFLGL